jgi:hypothetical protein
LVAVGLDWEYDPPAAERPPPDIKFDRPERIWDANAWLSAERARLWWSLWPYPFNAGAHFELGRSALEGNANVAALVHFTLARVSVADRPAVLRGQYVAAARLGLWAAAAATADHLVLLRPDAPTSWLIRATTSRHLGRNAEAERDQERLFQLVGDDPARRYHFTRLLAHPPPVILAP